MSNITLSIPEQIHLEMKHFPEVKWSEVARRSILEKLETLKLAEKLAKKSKFSDREVNDFSKKIKFLASKRFSKY